MCSFSILFWTEHQTDSQITSKSDNPIIDTATSDCSYVDDDDKLLEQPKRKKLCIGMFHQKVYHVSVTSMNNSRMSNL